MTDDQSDLLTIPAFLRRENTPEQQAKVKRLTARYSERRIKNPPKRIGRKRTGLGPMFGSSVRSL